MERKFFIGRRARAALSLLTVALVFAPVSAALLYVNSGCCCLSGVLSIVFLAVGLMGGQKGADA